MELILGFTVFLLPLILIVRRYIHSCWFALRERLLIDIWQGSLLTLGVAIVVLHSRKAAYGSTGLRINCSKVLLAESVFQRLRLEWLSLVIILDLGAALLRNTSAYFWLSLVLEIYFRPLYLYILKFHFNVETNIY